MEGDGFSVMLDRLEWFFKKKIKWKYAHAQILFFSLSGVPLFLDIVCTPLLFAFISVLPGTFHDSAPVPLPVDLLKSS